MKRLALGTMALALILPATAGAATIGATTVHPGDASTGEGDAKAYRFTAASTGQVDRLNVYLDGASTASRVEVGLYSGSDSSADTRRAWCVISSPQADAWNRCTFTAYSVTGGAHYWLALLHPSGASGNLQYREGQVPGAPESYLSKDRSLPSLPRTWTNASHSSDAYQASIYADQAGSPPPPDGDGDGVPDSSDQCPGTPAGTPVNAGGCPITLPPPTTPQSPTAAFSWSPANPAGPPARVDFDASATTCPAAPCTYRWLHGGVEFGTGVRTYFVYQDTGTKTVTLQVTDALFRVASVSRSFSVAAGTSSPTPIPAAPSAAFSWSPATPSAPPTRVDFDASATTCPAAPCTYRWLHENVEFGTGVKTSFVYQITGTKTVTLQVTDTQGRTVTLARSLFVAAAPAPTPTPTPTPGPAPQPGCDSSVSTYTGLQAALTSTASNGDTVCVTASVTGSKITTSADMTSRVRILAQPADGTVDMPAVNFNGASNITLEGFEFTGNRGVEVGGGSSGIHYIRNRCHDQQTTCVVWGSNSGFVMQGSRIERISLGGAWPNGYGIYTSGSATSPKVNYNLCDMGEIPSGDCFELGAMTNFEVIGNDIKNINGSGGAHADALMVWNRSRNGVVKDNRVADSTGMLLSPDTDDLRIENNLIVRAENRCLDGSPNGTSGQIAPLRWTWRNNTFWTCGYEAITQGGSTTGRGGQVFYDNVIEDGGTTGVSISSGNVSRTSIGLPGSFVGFNPVWSIIDYLPLNLPLGYGNAGYHPVPVGPAACPC